MSVLCIVPSTLRAIRSARRLCDAEGGLLLDARVSTLDAVAARVLAAGDGRPVLSPMAERLVCLEAGAAWPAFGGMGASGGLPRSLLSTIAELRRGEVRAADVRAGAAEVGGRRGERLAVIAEVLEGYERRLSELGVLDAPAALRAAAAAVTRGDVPDEFRDPSLLVVDGFHALVPAALDLVAALAHRARRTHVRVPYFPDRSDLCAPGEPLVRALEGLHPLAARRDVTVALDSVEERAPRLARVLRSVLGGPGGGPEGGGIVLAAEGAGEQGEAEAAAGAIASIIDHGIAPGDILVIASALTAATPRSLSRACAALGVPFATGRGPPLGLEPPVRAVRDAIAAAARPDRAALEAALAWPHLALAQPPRLRFWLERAGALGERGTPQEALRRRAATLTSPAGGPERAALLRSADALEAAVSALRPLVGAAVPRERARRLRTFLARRGARRRAARGEAEVVRRDLASLARLDEVVDDLVRALGLIGRGGEALTIDRWGELLEMAIDGASSDPPPEPAAGAVELWSLSDAPGLGARAAVVVGCARGAFPGSPPADALLGDAERAAVNRAARRMAIASGTMRGAATRHAAFCALAAGREALALTWPGAGPEGAGSGPAPLAVEVLALAGVDPDAAGARGGVRPRCISTLQALHAAARRVRSGEPGAARCLLEALPPPVASRAASAVARGTMEADRIAAVASRQAARFAGAIPAASLGAYRRALPREWTPSQLEEHARCPFRFYVGTVLGLSEAGAGGVDIDPRDEGRLAHAVLERFLRARLASGVLPLTGSVEERRHLAAIARDLFDRFEADGRTGDAAVWAARREAILRRLERVVEAEATAADGAVPALLEYSFGGDSPVPPLVFPDADGEVRLRGRLDRVDADRDRLVLIDYKDGKATATWKRKLEPEAMGDTNFQVPAYLMAAARALPGRARVEATYLLLRSAERVSPFTASAGDALFASAEMAGAPGRAGVNRPFAEAVVSAVRLIRGGVLPIASRDCTGCSFGAVCRFQARAEDEP